MDDTSGEAADTGSLLHAYVSSWHVNGQKAGDAIAQGDAIASNKFPLADRDRANKWFAAYVCDPRNAEAIIEAVEQPVELILPCAPHDPTGEPVYLRGTADQIRRGSDGRARVWDMKTGRTSGVAMIDLAAFQLAAYTLAGGAWLGEELDAPGIIRLQGYDVKGVDPSTSPGGVFFHSVLSWERCKMLVDEVVNLIADMRAGRVDIRPGYHCNTICPAKGLQTCLSLAERL